MKIQKGYYKENLKKGLLLKYKEACFEIYYNNRRSKYLDKQGNPKKLRYRDLSYNAFNTDHRWLRLLREYIQTYSMMAGVASPEHIDAMRLVVNMTDAPDAELADIILRNGLKIPEAINCLLDALTCRISSVKKAVDNTLIRLSAILQKDILIIIEKRLAHAATEETEKKRMKQLIERIHSFKT